MNDAVQMLLHGSSRPPADRLSLRAGPLTMEFDPELPFLRYVRFGGVEAVRAIYAAVRDHNWDTIPVQVTSLEVDRGEDRFTLRFQAVCRRGEVNYGWEGLVTGEADGTVCYRVEGQALSYFRRNRIGLCVLHPADCAGSPCEVEDIYGHVEQGRFPLHVSAHQPFFNVRRISHPVTPGVALDVVMEGDIFEMEDQRNWTDASFKTYCTPLALPFPEEVRPGDRVRQSVTLHLRGATAGIPAVADGPVQLEPTGEPCEPLPEAGLARDPGSPPVTPRQADLLRMLRPAHLRVDLHLGAEWKGELQRAAQDAAALHCGLEAAIYADGNANWEQVAAALRDAGPTIRRCLVLSRAAKVTPIPALRAARAAFAAVLPDTPVGGGTDASFTELNRNPLPIDLLDAVCFSINPQVHAFDDSSIVENLEAQGVVATDASRLYPGCPVVVSPITLRPRFKPDATAIEARLDPTALADDVDPRQASLLGAAWTLGSLKHLARGGVGALTYYQAVGRKGVLAREEDMRLPLQFPHLPGPVFPLFHVLADFGDFRGGEAIPFRSSAPLRADVLVLREGRRWAALVANYTSRNIQASLRPPSAGPCRLRVLFQSSLGSASASPAAFRATTLPQSPVDGLLTLTLPPYATARLDGTT